MGDNSEKTATFGMHKTNFMKKNIQNRLLYIIGIGVVLVCVFVSGLIFSSLLNIEKSVEFKIFPNQSVEVVVQNLENQGRIKHKKWLRFMLNVVDYKDRVHPGLYELKPGMSNFQLIRRLRSGLQTPVKLTFNNVRTIEELAGKFSRQLMADSTAFLTSFQDSMWLDSMKFTPNNAVCIFIPDTYEVWWNINPEKLRNKFVDSWTYFWNDKRKEEASRIKLSPVEVSILASIVEEETKKVDEMPKVAGLYLNRLRIEMPLQADPTVKFAVGDFTIRRILLEHTRIQSPYNTYLNIGLPPGPIRLPSKVAIEATLQAMRHTYIYMCAKDDFSGYHAFATTYQQHQNNAVKYRQALNKRGIMN